MILIKKEFNNIEYTKPIFLLLFLIFLLFTFLSFVFILNQFFSNKISFFISTIIVIGLYIIFKKKIVYKSDFLLFDDRVKFGNIDFDFDEIKSYRIHYIKGAGLKLNLKSGKNFRLSSNDNFCNSENFIRFCLKLDEKLSKYKDGKILKKQSFLESKIAYYFLIFMTISVFGIFIHSLITGKELRIGAFGLMIASLLTLWASIKTNK